MALNNTQSICTVSLILLSAYKTQSSITSQISHNFILLFSITQTLRCPYNLPFTPYLRTTNLHCGGKQQFAAFLWKWSFLTKFHPTMPFLVSLRTSTTFSKSAATVSYATSSQTKISRVWKGDIFGTPCSAATKHAQVPSSSLFLKNKVILVNVFLMIEVKSCIYDFRIP